jgi:DNA-binding response OmpR family regulator
VEDSSADVLIIRKALIEAGLTGPLLTVRDGEQAVRFIDSVDAGTAPMIPSLVLLDLNLPRIDGREVLRYLRRSRTLAETMVVVLSSSDSEKDRLVAAEHAVKRYIRKPLDLDEFLAIGGVVRSILSGGD